MQCSTSRTVLIVALGWVITFHPSRSCAQQTEEAVREILSQQAAAWNDGDIERFMDYYWKSEDLQFLGASGLTRGWEATVARYRRVYPDTRAMGQLKFDLIRINKRGDGVCTAIGQYHLAREGLDNLSGYFLLVFEKIDGKWLIVADSTH